MYYDWSYDFSGKLIGVPAESSFEGFDRSDLGLKPIDMEIFPGLIFTRFMPGGCSVAEELVPLREPLSHYRIEQMKPFGTHAITPIAADWKVAVENNSEAYHVPIGHPGLQRIYGASYSLEIPGNGTSRGGGQPCEVSPKSTWSERNYLSSRRESITFRQTGRGRGSTIVHSPILLSISIRTRSTTSRSCRSLPANAMPAREPMPLKTTGARYASRDG